MPKPVYQDYEPWLARIRLSLGLCSKSVLHVSVENFFAISIRERSAAAALYESVVPNLNSK
jgi:hypothetical protein